MVNGNHIYLHIKSADSSEPDQTVDALILSMYPEQDGWPDSLVDAAYYDRNRRGTGILDKISFRLGLKHANHDDIAAGKELFYYTFPSESVPPVQEKLAAPDLSEEAVFKSIWEQAKNGQEVTVPDGANLGVFCDALNIFIRSQKAEIASITRIAHGEEATLDQAVQQQAAPAEVSPVNQEGLTEDLKAVAVAVEEFVAAVEAAEQTKADTPPLDVPTGTYSKLVEIVDAPAPQEEPAQTEAPAPQADPTTAMTNGGDESPSKDSSPSPTPTPTEPVAQA